MEVTIFWSVAPTLATSTAKLLASSLASFPSSTRFSATLNSSALLNSKGLRVFWENMFLPGKLVAGHLSWHEPWRLKYFPTPSQVFVTLFLHLVLWVVFAVSCGWLSHLYVKKTKGMEPSGEIFTDLVIKTIWLPGVCPKWYRHLTKRELVLCQKDPTNRLPKVVKLQSTATDSVHDGSIVHHL